MRRLLFGGESSADSETTFQVASSTWVSISNSFMLRRIYVEFVKQYSSLKPPHKHFHGMIPLAEIGRKQQT